MRNHKKKQRGRLRPRPGKQLKPEFPDLDYSLPKFNDPAQLREWMKALNVSQSDLAREARVSQSFISALERGVEQFSEPSRTKIWRAIFRLNAERYLRLGALVSAEKNELNNLKALQALLAAPGLFKTPMELKEEEIERLKRELDSAIQRCNTLKQLVDMNLVDRCFDLEKRLADAHQQIADFHRLFALRGAAVAGDELQEQIEQAYKGSGER